MSSTKRKAETPEPEAAASAAAAAAASSTSSNKKPDTKEKASSETRAKEAREWFRTWFFLTPHMVDTHGMAPKEPYNNDEAWTDYYVEMDQWKEGLKEWEVEEADRKAKATAEGKEYKRESWNDPEPHPCEPLSMAAWTLKEGPFSCENEPIEPWSLETLKRIVTAAMKNADHCPFKVTDGLTLHEQMNRILQAEHNTAEVSHEFHPVGMLLAGIVMRANADWIADEDLEKMALAWGCKASARELRLNAIYKGQVELTREFVDKHWDLGQEARGYCVARGVLEDSKMALDLEVPQEERPDQRDRKGKVTLKEEEKEHADYKALVATLDKEWKEKKEKEKKNKAKTLTTEIEDENGFRAHELTKWREDNPDPGTDASLEDTIEWMKAQRDFVSGMCTTSDAESMDIIEKYEEGLLKKDETASSSSSAAAPAAAAAAVTSQ